MARKMMICGLIAGVVFIGALWFLIARRDLFSFGIFATFIVGLWIYGLIRFVIPNLRADGEFAMRVYGDRVECHCPLPHLAPTFNLPYESIHHLEKEIHAEASDTWAIVTHSGQQYRIPDAYENPAGQMVEAMLSIRPDLLVEVYNSSGPRRVLVSSGGVRVD